MKRKFTYKKVDAANRPPPSLIDRLDAKQRELAAKGGQFGAELSNFAGAWRTVILTGTLAGPEPDTTSRAIQRKLRRLRQLPKPPVLAPVLAPVKPPEPAVVVPPVAEANIPF